MVLGYEKLSTKIAAVQIISSTGHLPGIIDVFVYSLISMKLQD